MKTELKTEMNTNNINEATTPTKSIRQNILKKKSIPISNNFCPQTLFVYGTYNEDGTPDFGLFCWVSYYWGENLGVMAALCEDKRTRDNIRRSGVFSMGLVTEDMLPLADYFGNKSGYDPDKMILSYGYINHLL